MGEYSFNRVIIPSNYVYECEERDQDDLDNDLIEDGKVPVIMSEEQHDEYVYGEESGRLQEEHLLRLIKMVEFILDSMLMYMTMKEQDIYGGDYGTFIYDSESVDIYMPDEEGKEEYCLETWVRNHGFNNDDSADDKECLDEIIAEKDKELAQKEVELAEKDKTLRDLEERIAELEAMFKSQKSQSNQGSQTKKEEVEDSQEELLDLEATNQEEYHELDSKGTQTKKEEVKSFIEALLSSRSGDMFNRMARMDEDIVQGIANKYTCDANNLEDKEDADFLMGADDNRSQEYTDEEEGNLSYLLNQDEISGTSEEDEIPSIPNFDRSYLMSIDRVLKSSKTLQDYAEPEDSYDYEFSYYHYQAMKICYDGMQYLIDTTPKHERLDGLKTAVMAKGKEILDLVARNTDAFKNVSVVKLMHEWGATVGPYGDMIQELVAEGEFEEFDTKVALERMIASIGAVESMHTSSRYVSLLEDARKNGIGDEGKELRNYFWPVFRIKAHELSFYSFYVTFIKVRVYETFEALSPSLTYATKEELETLRSSIFDTSLFFDGILFGDEEAGVDDLFVALDQIVEKTKDFANKVSRVLFYSNISREQKKELTNHSNQLQLLANLFSISMKFFMSQDFFEGKYLHKHVE